MSQNILARIKGMNVKRLIVRVILVFAYIAATMFVFFNGRTHTILIDNKSLDDGSVSAFRTVKIYIDRQDPIELAARERDKIIVRGQSHKIKIDTNAEAKLKETMFKINFADDTVLLSVPKMAAGLDGFIEPFITEHEKPKDETITTDASVTGSGL